MESKRKMEEMAADLGFDKVSDLKLGVVEKIREYVVGGGFMFAMCSATDTYDIALAAAETDIADWMFDGRSEERRVGKECRSRGWPDRCNTQTLTKITARH